MPENPYLQHRFGEAPWPDNAPTVYDVTGRIAESIGFVRQETDALEIWGHLDRLVDDLRDMSDQASGCYAWLASIAGRLLDAMPNFFGPDEGLLNRFDDFQDYILERLDEMSVALDKDNSASPSEYPPLPCFGDE